MKFACKMCTATTTKFSHTRQESKQFLSQIGSMYTPKLGPKTSKTSNMKPRDIRETRKHQKSKKTVSRHGKCTLPQGKVQLLGAGAHPELPSNWTFPEGKVQLLGQAGTSLQLTITEPRPGKLLGGYPPATEYN